MKKSLEDRMQVACADFLRGIQAAGSPIVFKHTPNGGKRNRVIAALLKRMGVLAGWPDLDLALPAGMGADHPRTLRIEIKTDTGRLSPAQKAVHAALAAIGHPVRLLKAGCPASAVLELKQILREEGVPF